MSTPRTTKRIQDAFSLARHNRYDALKELMSDELNPLHPDQSDKKGNTILLVACQNGLKRIVKLSLKMGADINATNNAGNTALHFCYMYGFGSNLAGYLIEKGADDGIRNLRGKVCYEVNMKPGGGSGATTPDDGEENLSFSPSKIARENFTFEEIPEEVAPEGGGWESDYLEQYVDGGYESNEVWGGEVSGGEIQGQGQGQGYGGDYYGNDDNFWSEGGGLGREQKEEGGSHYTDEEGRQCFVDEYGSHYYWDTEGGSGWIPFNVGDDVAEEKLSELDISGLSLGEGEDKEGGVEEDGEPKTWAEARPNENLYKQKFKVSKTRRKPPAEKKKRQPPKPPGEGRKEGGEGKEESDSGSSSGINVDGKTLKNPQMALMEACAGQNMRMIRALLENPLLSRRDIHAALLNATAKGGFEIVKLLVGKASKSSVGGCLLIACKLAHVNLIKLLIPLVQTAAISRAVVACSTTGQTSLLNLFFGGKSEGTFDIHEVQRILMACASKNMWEALKVIVPLINREYDGGDDVKGLSRAYKQALTSAAAKGHLKIAGVLVDFVLTDDLQSVLSLAAGKGDVKMVGVILDALKRDRGKMAEGFYEICCRHACEVARGKGKLEVVGVLTGEMGGMEKKGSYSAKELMRARGGGGG
ncbi:hypothetical protein TL16_g01072 [Triparma laevis f. inornata]|uniref:Uncharacterized protein n=1 Tax=Triparma laevis f. inornata TaxID=1714386 RepID=A0A9W6ZGI5_9STRA|nr:hypothetical protein TL16_g01072 [Triparma laevis f. inornata]